jgi:RecB family exonuclease
LKKFYEESWVDDWFESKKKKQERKKQGQEILKGFYEKYKDNWPSALFLEKGFNLKITDGKDSYVVRGAIDRIDQAGEGLKLVDYKTGKPKDKLEFKDKEQLLIYQLAVQELFKQEVKTLAFYYLDDNSEVEFIGSAKDLEKIKVKIIDTIKEIKQGKFKANPGVLCAWCDFKEICEFRG